MKITRESLKNRKIMVVGLAKTGVALVRFLCAAGVQVSVSDHKSVAELSDILEDIEDLDIHYDLGGHSPKAMLAQEMIILSPGVFSGLHIFHYARQHGVKVISDIEFASQMIKEPIIAITGTNGKTTMAEMTHLFLSKSGIKTWIGGNYGRPLIEYVTNQEKADVLICEVSSFQLELVETFNPRTIVFTNIAPNHFDRYKSFEEYIMAKKRIFLNVHQDVVSILNADDSQVVDMARDPVVQRGGILYFSRRPVLEEQIMNIGGGVHVGQEIHVCLGPQKEIYSTQGIQALGSHSIENLIAAIIASRRYGAKPEVIQDVMNGFKGLPHRIEYVRKVGGVKFYNDSKATNVHAVKRALATFDENVILICGGKDANLIFDGLADMIKGRVKTLILFGESKEKINRSIGTLCETFLIGTFEEAVLMAYQKSKMNDIVLLSPGCPSFDLFDSYIERGNHFKKIIYSF